MNLQILSDQTLLTNTLALAQAERDTTLKVLHHLREVERRYLYAKLSYPSLFEYAVKELKYSQGAAHRRISSMRLIKELPELEAKVEAGTLTLSALSQAQTFFRQEKKTISTREEKNEVLASLENKSLWEVQKELASRSSEPVRLLAEKLRPLSQTHSELKLVIGDDLLKELAELRNLLAHQKPHASLGDLISYAVGHTLKALRPKPPKVVPATIAKRVLTPVKAPSRHIPPEIKRQVWARDGGQCNFSDAPSGKVCGTKHGLEYDHIRPFALGGAATVANLRLRCPAHNQLAAIATFGAQKMSAFLPRIRDSVPQGN